MEKFFASGQCYANAQGVNCAPLDSLKETYGLTEELGSFSYHEKLLLLFYIIYMYFRCHIEQISEKFEG